MQETIKLRNESFNYNIDLTFNGEINLDKLLKIDYSNLEGEFSYFTVILNRVAFLLAQAENELREAKFNLDSISAMKSSAIRESLTETNQRGTVKKPTSGEVNDLLFEDEGFIKQSIIYNEKIKNRDILSQLYWSAKEKSNILKNLSQNFTPINTKQQFLEYLSKFK